MIGIFKKNLFVNSLLLLPFAILVNIGTIIKPRLYDLNGSETVLSRFILNHIQNEAIQTTLGILLIYFQAIYINRLVIKNRLLREITLLPGLFYILLISLLPEFLSFSPQLIAVTFLLGAMSQIFKIYKKHTAAMDIFNIGFLLAMTSLFVNINTCYIILGFISLLTMRSINIKELLQLLSGAFTATYLYHGVAYFLNTSTIKDFTGIYTILDQNLLSLDGYSAFKVLLYLALSILMVFAYRKFITKQGVMVQKRIDMVFWLLAISGIIIFFKKDVVPMDVYYILFPLSLHLTLFILRLKNNVFQELIFLGMLVLTFVSHFIIG